MSTSGMRRVGLGLAAALVLAGVVGVVVHYSGFESNTIARIGAFAPWLMLAAVVGLVLAAVLRGWWLTGLAAVVVIVGVIAQAPLYFGTQAPGTGDIRVMQANIYLGQADIDQLARQVRDEQIDLLTVSELTEPARDRIASSSIVEQLPYSFTHTADHGGGIGLYSRYPLTEGKRLDGFRLSNARAVADIPGFGQYVVYALHPLPPYPEPAWRWGTELKRLADTMNDDRLPIIAAGDFNSTYNHRQLRQLLGDGPHGARLTDAAEHTGVGVIATYPAGRAFPALLALDRVMTRGGPEAVDFYRLDLSGSDHHPVVAELKLS